MRQETWYSPVRWGHNVALDIPRLLLAKRVRSVLFTYMALCFAVCTACSCTVGIPARVPLRDVRVVACKEIDQEEPFSVTDVFTEDDHRICVHMTARQDGSLDEWSSGDGLFFTFTWYFQEKQMGQAYSGAEVAQDGQLVASACTISESGPFSRGEYRATVEFGSQEIGSVEYVVE